MNHIQRILSATAVLLFVTACSSDKKTETLSDPDTLYRSATSQLNSGEFEKASSIYEQLEREHPSSDLAVQAQIYRAYARYLDGKFDEAAEVIDSFVKQNPANRSTPYMYYLKGLCYYDQILDVGRDQELSKKSIAAFKELITRFPESVYSKDAQLKLEFANNSLAGKEMEIAHFYMVRKEPIAALNRYKTVVDNYQTTIFIEEALYRLSEIYYTLGDVQQAKNYASVLGHNYPQSDWYKKAYSLFAETSDSGNDRKWYEIIEW